MSRRVALSALTEWEESSRFASDILSDLSSRHDLSGPDRALAQELLFGVIRNLYFVDEIIEKLRKARLKTQTRNLLRLGIYQLFKTDIAEHAAVNETVILARKHEKPLVNAILRNAQRQKVEIVREAETWSLEDRTSHPSHLIERWQEQHGDDATEQLCGWNNCPPEVFARINPLAPDKEALNRVRSETQPCLIGPEFPDFFRVEGAPNYEWLDAGLIYIQDPSTSLSCRLLAAQPGERILDACAAPGGKASLLAAAMEEQGSLVAADNSAVRLEKMQGNLQRLGVGFARTTLVDWIENPPSDLEPFDAILLDAPCSNTGVMRRRIDVRWRLQPWDFPKQAETQTALLASMRPFLKPGGRLIYSTCSIDREENEAIVEASNFQVETIERCLPWRDGYDGAFAALLRA